MKRVILSLALVMISLLIVGCVDYKATPELINNDLVDEIAEIEENISVEEEIEEIVVEEKENVSEMQVINVKENQYIKLNTNINDPNNDEVTYEFSKPLSPEGEWDINYGDAGEYIITLTATDGELITEKLIRLVVEKVNVAPIIETPSNINVSEGEVIQFEPGVYDPNGDEIIVNVSGPLAEGEFFADYESAGEYKIIITATDGELTAEESFMLTIENVNRKPTIEGVDEEIFIKEGETLTLEPIVTDLDNDEVIVTISEPLSEGTWTPSYTDAGEYMITIIAEDGEDKTVKTIKIIVEAVNMPPEIVDVSLDVN